MYNKPGLLKRRVFVLLCLALVATISAVTFWPLPCDRMMTSEHGNIIFLVVTPIFSSTETIPTFTSQQWMVPKDSNVYSEILSVMGDYYCHRKISNSTQNNHQPWMNVYSENGRLIFSWKGSSDFDTEDACYTLYGRNSGQIMMNTIYDILQAHQNILTK